MKKKDEKIAIVIYNYVQYLNIINGVKQLIKNGYDIDFYCGEIDDNSGYNSMFNDIAKVLKNQGYSVYRKRKNYKYKIVIDPYKGVVDLDSKYRIRYRYGPIISVKPNKVIKVDDIAYYDCVLCSGSFEASIVNGLAHPELLADLKYMDFKHKKNPNSGNKKVLLYLPTYGEESSIDLINNALKKLKNDYYIIAKMHHGTSFLTNEKGRTENIKDIVDECYDLHTDLTKLLEKSDVVLSDNSNAIFEAMYVNVPVAVFSNDINQSKLGDLNTAQYELYKQKILPYTNDVKKVKNILEKALSKEIMQAQKNWSKENFVYSKTPTEDFVRIIDKYYYDGIDMHEYLTRKMIVEKFNEKEDYIDSLWKAIKYQESLLDEYRNGKLYKIASKIYKLKSGNKKN